MRAKHLVYVNLELVVPPISLKKKEKGERDCVHVCYKERDTRSEDTHSTSKAQSSTSRSFILTRIKHKALKPSLLNTKRKKVQLI